MATPSVPNATGLVDIPASYDDECVKASCRSYLNLVAHSIGRIYIFAHQDPEGNPTIQDVLIAKDGPEGDSWEIETYCFDEVQRDCYGNKHRHYEGQPMTETPLPELFTAAQWEQLAEFDKKVGKVKTIMPHTTWTGTLCVFVPRVDYNKEFVEFLRTIGLNANRIERPEDLVVECADPLTPSGSECGSESGSECGSESG